MSDRDWTIYFRDGSSEPPAVHPGHGREDYEGWERLEVVRALDFEAAVKGLRAIYAWNHMAGDGQAGKVSGAVLRALGFDPDAEEPT